MAVQYISVSYAALNSTDKRLICAPSTHLASDRQGRMPPPHRPLKHCGNG